MEIITKEYDEMTEEEIENQIDRIEFYYDDYFNGVSNDMINSKMRIKK